MSHIYRPIDFYTVNLLKNKKEEYSVTAVPAHSRGLPNNETLKDRTLPTMSVSSTVDNTTRSLCNTIKREVESLLDGPSGPSPLFDTYSDSPVTTSLSSR